MRSASNASLVISSAPALGAGKGIGTPNCGKASVVAVGVGMQVSSSMCSRDVSPEAGDMERYWHTGTRTPWRASEVFPRASGQFIGSDRTAALPERQLVIGQWGLVPWFAKAAKLPYATNNARFEGIASKASFKHSWQSSKRCIIPAISFDEPNWESGKNAWWRFRRADGAPWGLAGLWNVWADSSSGEIVES